MPVSTTLQRRILFQRLVMIVICAVLGVWGVYDYLVKIPVNMKLVARGEVYRDVRRSIESAVAFPAGSPEALQAVRPGTAAVQDALRPLLEAGRTDEGETGLDAAQFMDQLRARNEDQWFQELLLMQAALNYASTGIREPDGSMNAEFGVFVDDFLLPRVNATAAISPPSDFDRLIQWAFILCLPMVPWVIWTLMRDARGGYRLDEDGTLHYPGGSIGSDAIVDIDMRRWMSKSVAEVVASDGRRVRLDDYIHKGTDRIVGAFAHRFHPEAWTLEAKEVKASASGGTAADGSRDERAGREEAGRSDDAAFDADEDAAAAHGSDAGSSSATRM
jgi:hypothetical protein